MKQTAVIAINVYVYSMQIVECTTCLAQPSIIMHEQMNFNYGLIINFIFINIIMIMCSYSILY